MDFSEPILMSIYSQVTLNNIRSLVDFLVAVFVDLKEKGTHTSIMPSPSSIKLATLLLIAATTLLVVPPVQSMTSSKPKIVVVTNNHTNYLSIRCFSFNNAYDVTHLPPWGQFKFRVYKRVFYPSATMFNCSTNMGTFVAFKFNYECTDDKYDTCDWRFDEDSVYRWEPTSNVWSQLDYQPNYESLDRGGVIAGYFAN